MSDFNDIQNLWQSQPAVKIPDVELIIKAANKNRKQMITKNVLALVTLGGTLIFSAYIGLVADFQFVTTKLGIVIIMISISAALIINSQLLSLILNKTNDVASNQDYLNQLIAYRNKQRFFQTKGIAAYFLLLTLGFILYLYEFYARNHAFGIKAYATTLLWIAFAWFYLRPRRIKKQEKKINDLISQIESISGQLEK